MIVRIGIRNPETKDVDEVTGDSPDYDAAKAAAEAKVPAGWQLLHIDVER